MVVSVDRGNGMTKAYTYRGKHVIFPSYATRAKFREIDEGGDLYRIKINGVDWFTGELARLEGGMQGFGNDKVSDETTIPLTLTAIAALSEVDSEHVYLVTGVPISDYQERSAELKQALNQEYAVEFNNRIISVKIMDIIVFPEGAGAAWSTVLDDMGRGRAKPETLRVIDIGERTVDFATFSNLRYVASESASLPIGVSWAKKDTYKRLPNRMAYMLNEVEPDSESKAALANMIQSELNKWWRRWDSVYLAGGGAQLVKDYLPFPVIANPQLANAIGYFRVGMAKWQKL